MNTRNKIVYFKKQNNMCDNIWIVGSRIYKTKQGFEKAIDKYGDYGLTYEVYKLTRSGNTNDVLKERKIQEKIESRSNILKCVLGELTQKQEKEEELKLKISDFIKELKRVEHFGLMDELENCDYYKRDPFRFKRIFIQHKKYLFRFSSDVDYYKSVLRINNFRKIDCEYISSCTTYHPKFKAIKIETTGLNKVEHTTSQKLVFNIAKKSIKKDLEK